MIDHARPARSRLVRAIYAGLGFLFLGLGGVGIFVPLLPTTINLILAAFFFPLRRPHVPLADDPPPLRAHPA